jgi:lipid-binding SYLF domain-containing protein
MLMRLILNAVIGALVVAGIAGIGLVVGCSTAPKSGGDTAALAADSQAALASFKAKDPSLQSLMDRSVGWAVFPNIGKAGFVVGGSYGRGEVYERGAMIGYADISEVSGGLQIGAQNFSEILLFLRQEDLDKLKRGDFSLGANASAVALTAGAAAKTDPSKGVIALVETKGGLMAEAAVAGQRLRYQPK